MMEAMDASLASGLGSLALAKIESVDGAALRVSGRSFGASRARLAVAGTNYLPRAGDTVLVGRADDGGLYVVGVVRALREASAGLRASDGTSATLEADDGAEVLRVRDPEGRLLVEHRTADGTTVVQAGGDLALRTDGDLELAAQGAVRVRAGTDLELEGQGDVRIVATDPDGEDASSFAMRGGRSELKTRRLGAKLDRADLSLAEANVVVGTMRTVATRVKQEAEVLEVQASRLVEKTQEAWRETEGLSQTRAGRLRLVAAGALQAIGEHTLLKAREGVKIKGEKIYLA